MNIVTGTNSNWNTNGLLPTASVAPVVSIVQAAGSDCFLFGLPVQRNDAYRPGLLMLNQGFSFWSASLLTLEVLAGLTESNQAVWTKVHELIHEAYLEGGRTMKTVMVDLSHTTAFKKPTTKPVGRTRDRVDSVCVSITGLVAELAPFCEEGGRTASDVQIRAFAVKYGKLRDEMRKLRTAMDHADGMFEVAQMQIVALMNEDEVDA